MAATSIPLKWTVVVQDSDRQPLWLQELCNSTGELAEDLVAAMIRAEMETAGEAFMTRWPELFQYPENGLA